MKVDKKIINAYKIYDLAFNKKTELFKQIKSGNDICKVLYDNKELNFVIKCSDDIKDWISNFDLKPDNEYYEFHNGFNISAKLLIQKVVEYIKEKNVDKINMIGVSRGGAIALILAQMLTEKFPQKEITCTTFGQPKAVTAIKAMSIDVMGKIRYTRVFFENDIITKLPLHVQGFAHVQGQEVVLPAKWWHKIPLTVIKMIVHTRYDNFFKELK